MSRFAVPRLASIGRGDLDGFFGLMVDNLLQFLVIYALCTGLCGFPPDFVLTRIFPGAALSLIVGNLYYARLARRLSLERGRPMTALPYGINTVSLFAYVLFVMAPTYAELAADPAVSAEQAARTAWQVGLVACLLSGLIEAAGGWGAGWVRKITPRAALLSTLAGIAIGFISMEFILRSFDKPLIALAPLALVLVTYLSRVRWPGGLPGGLIAVAVGTALAWLIRLAGWPGGVGVGGENLLAGAGFHPPMPALGDLSAALASPHVWGRISIIVPMGLINLLGALQCIESAEAEGDSYPERPCLVANGVGSVAAACFGSCFPTTIYIGHPGWKRMGAGWAYSAANGIFFGLLALFGLIGPIARIVPVEAAMAILVWIAVIITAQAFTATPARHAPAVVLGLLPGLAAWGWLLVEMTTGSARLAGRLVEGATLPVLVEDLSRTTLPYVGGLLTLKAGFLFSATFLAAIGVFLAERRFGTAAFWALVAAAFTWVGLMHAYTITPAAVREEIRPGFAWPMAVGYLAVAAVALAARLLARPVEETAEKGT
ncbi:MAG: NCS2 family permease [Acidobacteriota bacterium]|nr:NCS2 family permease [Acidobacteriota bacterium]MDQ7086471.1 NCS2 family permease [Acidobacteriota bacterium]